MIMSFHSIIMLPRCTALLVAGCQEKAPTPPAGEEAGHDDEDGEIDLSAEQIHGAGIELVTVVRGGAGALTVPATIEGNPQGLQVVSAETGGRGVSLTRHLGPPIESGRAHIGTPVTH